MSIFNYSFVYIIVSAFLGGIGYTICKKCKKIMNDIVERYEDKINKMELKYEEHIQQLEGIICDNLEYNEIISTDVYELNNKMNNITYETEYNEIKYREQIQNFKFQIKHLEDIVDANLEYIRIISNELDKLNQ